MDKLEKYRTIIKEILIEYARVPYSYGDIQIQTIFDRDSDHYVVLIVGRDHQNHRVHGCLVHIDIINQKIWIQRDGSEQGMAQELLDAGIPKEDIVLAFKPVEIRPYTGFAIN